MRVEIALQCHYFQRRLCWMLSSLLDQERPGVDLSVSVAHVPGTGDPDCRDVIKLFREEGLDVRGCEYPNIDEFQYRGWTRNRQLDECDADWIIFADSDMVYPPDFFRKTGKLLKGPLRGNPHCLYSRRFSTELEPTEQMMLVPGDYPTRVRNAHTLASVLPGGLKANVGAGYFQMCDVALLKKNHGHYQKRGKKIDWSWARRQKAKSDMHFRKMLGGEAVGLPVQIHLQHVRDADFGKHVEVQR